MPNLHAASADPDVPARPQVSFAQLVAVFARIGVLSFGGPAGQIALMHRELVERHAWIDERTYLSALNFCMLLPGPEAMQLATYVGWRLHGVRGGLAAGLLFVLPGAALVFVLALLYANFGQLPLVATLFLGIKAAVLVIVVEALLRVARRALKGGVDWLIASAAFVAIFAFSIPFPLVVLAAALTGYLRGNIRAAPSTAIPAANVPLLRTLRTLVVGSAIWLLPLAAVVASLGWDHVVSQLAWFFSKLAVVTFGGAYAVLAYMAQDVVQHYGWMTAGEMLDALGLAETTPGPLILVTEFVATLASWRHGGGPPLLMAALGAAVGLWATFVPCFVWIFAGAPYLERINAAPRLASALAAVTAAVVGVIANLTVWFALHVLFKHLSTLDAPPLHIPLPDLTSIDATALALSCIAGVLLFALHRGVVTTLAITAALSLLYAAVL